MEYKFLLKIKNKREEDKMMHWMHNIRFLSSQFQVLLLLKYANIMANVTSR